MTDHEEHDHGHEEHDHEEHEHHHHAYDWAAELQSNRDFTANYYEHEFDWRGHQPPQGYEGPRWFPAAPDWRLVARLDQSAPGAGEHAEIATSTGQVRHMHVAGDLVFQADGAEHRLTAFVSERDGYEVLFIPFRDATSGHETYGSGRYVEAPLTRRRPTIRSSWTSTTPTTHRASIAPPTTARSRRVRTSSRSPSAPVSACPTTRLTDARATQTLPLKQA